MSAAEPNGAKLEAGRSDTGFCSERTKAAFDKFIMLRSRSCLASSFYV